MALGAGGGGGGLLLAETGAPSLGVGAGGLASGRADMERNLPHLAAHAAGVGRAAAQILTVPLAGRIDRLAVHALVVGALRRGAAEVDVGHAVEWGQYDALGRHELELPALRRTTVLVVDLGRPRLHGGPVRVGAEVEVDRLGGLPDADLEGAALVKLDLDDRVIPGSRDLQLAGDLPDAVGPRPDEAAAAVGADVDGGDRGGVSTPAHVAHVHHAAVGHGRAARALRLPHIQATVAVQVAVLRGHRWANRRRLIAGELSTRNVGVVTPRHQSQEQGDLAKLLRDSHHLDLQCGLPWPRLRYVQSRSSFLALKPFSFENSLNAKRSCVAD